MPKQLKIESLKRIVSTEDLKGPQGLPGIQGATGPVGERGPIGPKGEKGDVGPQGDRGATGLTGARGPQGVQGPQGDLGPMPQHQSRGDALRFEMKPGVWGSWIAIGGTERVIGGGGSASAASALEVLDEGISLTSGATSLDFVGNGVVASAVGSDVTVTITDTDTTDHTLLSNIGTNTHAQIDTHIADATIHFTEGSIDHGSISGLGDDDHLQYLLLAGRSGGQTAIGSTVAGERLTLQGSSAGGDVGFIDFNSPLQLNYDTFSDATQFAMVWDPTVSITGSYIGGALQTAANMTVTTGVFIPAIFSDTNQYAIAATPGFSAITFINELSTVRNSGNFNLPGALVMNVGLTHERNTSGTSTTSGTTGISFSPQTRTTVSGAVMTKTDQTAVRCSPTWSTVAGSTVNLGTIRGLHCFSPALALFQPGGGVENMTAYYGLDFNAITFGGTAPIAVVRSALAAGTNQHFLLNNGNAISDFGTGHCYFDDNGSIAMGGVGSGLFDVVLNWQAAGYFRIFFNSTGDDLRWSSPSADRFLFDNVGGNTTGEYNFNCARFSMGAQTGAVGNQVGAFVAGTRSVSVGGEWSDFLLTQAGNITVNAAMGLVAGWTINAPSITLGTGSVTTAAGLNIGGNPTNATNRVGLRIISNPSGGAGINAALWITAGLSRFDGRVDINNAIALGGGAPALLGTIGGTGPTAAAQATWVEIDVGGVAHWIPAWT